MLSSPLCETLCAPSFQQKGSAISVIFVQQPPATLQQQKLCKLLGTEATTRSPGRGFISREIRRGAALVVHEWPAQLLGEGS